MSTEKQLRALRNWLNRDIPAGETICEMPADICSSALSELCAASDARQNGEKNGYTKVKRAVIAKLREQGWIGIPADAPGQTPLHQPDFGERAEAELQKIREEQGFAKETAKPVAESSAAALITKYVEILTQVTEAVAKEERIPDSEKGDAVKFVYDSVKAEINI